MRIFDSATSSSYKVKILCETPRVRQNNNNNNNMAKELSKEELKSLWNRFDYNGNGKLSLAEIDKAVIEVYPDLGKDKPALIRAYKAADTSGDGFIEKGEFAKLMKFLFYYDKLYKDFQQLDTNGDRRLTLDEFVKGHEIAGIQGKHTKEEYKKMFDSIDTNHGGYILFEEKVVLSIQPTNRNVQFLRQYISNVGRTSTDEQEGDKVENIFDLFLLFVIEIQIHHDVSRRTGKNAEALPGLGTSTTSMDTRPPSSQRPSKGLARQNHLPPLRSSQKNCVPPCGPAPCTRVTAKACQLSQHGLGWWSI
ncbi:hypothetical protein PROFUN_04326 [Planoprotostelium fungivorum]|uniref:EF-hand domain-containing protein n=1 Tax=Planoprotostelium fungivorum TaxID=1890364 RepID=A0A2P6NV56_9EUKA|nr:hypothetical protein PROFUN_04326 [Planoprotostelium fungivorum]